MKKFMVQSTPVQVLRFSFLRDFHMHDAVDTRSRHVLDRI